MNEFSKKFIQALIEIYPEWTACVKPYRKGRGAPAEHIVLTVPAPIDGYREELIVSTGGDVVTVSFDRFTTVFSPEDVTVHEETIRDSLECIQGLVREETAVLIRKRDGVWQSEILTEPAEDIEKLTGSHYYVRSWAGTFNADRLSFIDRIPWLFRSASEVPRKDYIIGLCPVAVSLIISRLGFMQILYLEDPRMYFWGKWMDYCFYSLRWFGTHQLVFFVLAILVVVSLRFDPRGALHRVQWCVQRMMVVLVVWLVSAVLSLYYVIFTM